MPPGEGAHMHDWRFMLGKLDLLEWDKAIEWIFRLTATGTMLFGLAFGAWLLYRMMRSVWTVD